MFSNNRHYDKCIGQHIIRIIVKPLYVRVIIPWDARSMLFPSLGTPKEEKVSKHPKDEWDFILSYYDNISFGFYRSEFCINLINITGKEYKTYRGISVGDDISIKE